jgi:hypothetical protein
VNVYIQLLDLSQVISVVLTVNILVHFPFGFLAVNDVLMHTLDLWFLLLLYELQLLLDN